MPQLSAYLYFTGQCREAMNFYKDCLGGELSLQSVEESPMADQWPKEAQKGILHSTLTKGGLVLMASDMGDHPPVDGNTIFLALSCDNPEELDTTYAKLTAGGQALREPHDFFAGRMAVLKDKYGKYWQLYSEKPI